ncbi:Protein of unknown function [Collimonas sp. OK607]|uniref:DUF1329 domain-containing protein n=1 Tax=Collimonas sp. OK607 TaxID=1798194 RepID=UPI0008ED3CE4|nr:DUF1329 domain-containing protein [Collimonas sp. OK607]SFB34626.1 Protein of unknown function [Collimonas sp. OK607]
MNKQQFLRPAIAGLIASLLCHAGLTNAAVSAEEALKLKSELTPLGAEKAGNREGTIPAWTGGYTKVPSGYKPGNVRPDPFSDEKPLYSITAKNMAEYADKLSDGQQVLLKKYPSYRIDVYPTHRTAAAPQSVYDNTLKNATRAKSSANGYSINGAFGGIPFPIPKNGAEAMWNHQLRWQGESVLYSHAAYVMSGGKPLLAATVHAEMSFPYFFKEDSLETFKGDYWHLYQVTTAPAYKAGESFLVRDPVDYEAKGRQAWQYLVGQRRVRRGPSLAYDTPNSVTSGVDFFDEVSLFLGALDKYQWKLVGKKEMYIPYNDNKFFQKTPEEVLGQNYLNPDDVRWELHRVWVVEATLAPGKRHVIPKKKFYLDEDTWDAVLYDGWDAQSQLWHSGMALPILAFEYPGVITYPFSIQDLLKGSYQATIINGQPTQYGQVPRWPESNFTPESMAARGVN